MEQLERITHMEGLLDTADAAVNALSNALDAYAAAQDAIRELTDYYTSPLWMADYDDDCAGRLPKALKRGVLSEDAVFNMLQKRTEALDFMRTLCAPPVQADARLAYWERCFGDASRSPCDDYDGWLAPYLPNLPKGSRVLDLGCGDGVSIGALLEAGLFVTAADFSPSAVAAAEARFPGIDTACFDMTVPFPFESASFSAVVADLSLHYFTWADTQRILGEIQRVLTPGGMLLARVHAVGQVDPQGLCELEPNYYVFDGHPRRYFTHGELEALLAVWHIRTLRETQITRFGHAKRVFEIAAIRPGHAGETR